jgi:hypothetical protein
MGDAATMQQTRGLAGGAARAWACGYKCAHGRGWYKSRMVHLWRLCFVWSRGVNDFDSRSASAAACVAGGGKTYERTRIKEGDLYIGVKTNDAKFKKRFVSSTQYPLLVPSLPSLSFKRHWQGYQYLLATDLIRSSKSLSPRATAAAGRKAAFGPDLAPPLPPGPAHWRIRVVALTGSAPPLGPADRWQALKGSAPR